MTENETNLKTGNYIFLKLSIIVFCLSLSSISSYFLSLNEGRLSVSKGIPSDEAILYSFLYGLVIAQIINLFVGEGSILKLLQKEIALTVLKSLPVIASIWGIIAGGGSHLSEEAFSKNSYFSGESEWFQIFFVLLATGVTFVVWHTKINHEIKETEQEAGTNSKAPSSLENPHS